MILDLFAYSSKGSDGHAYQGIGQHHRPIDPTLMVWCHPHPTIDQES
jgi:hypothetical protein